jgi:hypothetical protein
VRRKIKMAKYVRCESEYNFDLKIKDVTKGKIYKVIDEDASSYWILNDKNDRHVSWKKNYSDATILDIALQRVNNIVIGTLNYVSDEFEEEEEISISKLPYNKSLFLHGCNISIVKENKGLSDCILFQSAQQAKEYINKFTKIIDDININHHNNKPKYKINSDKLYTEDAMVRLKELGIDFVEVE